MKQTIDSIINKAKAILKPEDPTEGVPKPSHSNPTEKTYGSPAAVSQAGYMVGEEVTAAVSAKQCPNGKLCYIEVPDWDGLAVAHVQDQRDWRPSDRMVVKFVRMRPDYVLEFAGPAGKRLNKFGRR